MAEIAFVPRNAPFTPDDRSAVVKVRVTGNAKPPYYGKRGEFIIECYDRQVDVVLASLKNNDKFARIYVVGHNPDRAKAQAKNLAQVEEYLSKFGYK